MNVLIAKIKKLAVIPWFFLTVFLFIVSITIVFAAIPGTLAAQVNMEVYQKKGLKIFGQETVLDIFNDPKLNGKKLVHPFSKGSYVFGVYNRSNYDGLPYSLEITAENPENIPLMLSLQKNGAYVFGGEGLENMLPFSAFHFPDEALNGYETDVYTLQWQWLTETDNTDTDIGNIGTQLYHVYIKAIGTMPEINTLPPATGDGSHILLWAMLLVVSIIILFGLQFLKRRKLGEDAHHKNNPKDQ